MLKIISIDVISRQGSAVVKLWNGLVKSWRCGLKTQVINFVTLDLKIISETCDLSLIFALIYLYILNILPNIYSLKSVLFHICTFTFTNPQSINSGTLSLYVCESSSTANQINQNF